MKRTLSIVSICAFCITAFGDNNISPGGGTIAGGGSSGSGGSGANTDLSNITANGTNVIIANSSGAFKTNAIIVMAITNVFVSGLGPNGGQITFPANELIKAQSQANSQQVGDSGLSFGISMGQIFGETYTIQAGAFDDIAGSNLGQMIGDTVFGVSNVVGNATASTVNYSGILGGFQNIIYGTGGNGLDTIAGGFSNTINVFYNGNFEAGISNIESGVGGSVPQGNTGGLFDLGVENFNTNGSTFMWNDGSAGWFTSKTNNSFIVHAANGVGLGTNYTGGNQLRVQGNADFPVSATFSGTIGGAGFTNEINTLYNDTNALTFLNSVGVWDDAARNDVIRMVNDQKAMGTFGNLVDVGMLDTRFNPTKHLTFFLNPFTVINEQYTNLGQFYGAYCTGNTIFTEPSPVLLTNATLVIWYMHNPSNVDQIIQGNLSRDGSDGQALAAAYSTNNYSGAVLSPWSSHLFSQVWASSLGTNFGAQSGPNNTSTNKSNMLMNGNYDSRTPAGLPYVTVISFNTNGLISRWTQARPERFTGAQPIATNVIQLSQFGVINQFQIGGAGTNWNLAYHPAGFDFLDATNFSGIIGGWAIYNQSIEANPALNAASWNLATDLMRYRQVVDFVGSSIINFSVGGGNLNQSGSISETNTMPTIYQQQNPDTFVMCDASPGSQFLNWNNGTTYIPFSFSNLMVFNTNKYQDRKIIGDPWRNDTLVGSSVTTLLSQWGTYMEPIRLGGWKLYPMKTHYAYANGGVALPVASNYSNWMVLDMIVSNYPVSGVIDENKYWSSNTASVLSIDNPPVHANALTLAAHNYQAAVATICAFQPWPQTEWDIRQLSISGGGLVNDSGITSMTNLLFGVKDQYGNSRWTQDGSGLTNTQPNVVFTNWISGFVYTNASGATLKIHSALTNIVTGVAGMSQMQLQTAPTTNGVLSLTAWSGMSSLVTSLAATNFGNLDADIPSGGKFTFTNLSTGTGDSASLVNGSGYMRW